MKMRTSPTTDQASTDLSASLTKWLNGVNPVDVWPSCASCHFLQKDDRTCDVFKAQPPVSVVVMGCGRYSDKEGIPF